MNVHPPGQQPQPPSGHGPWNPAPTRTSDDDDMAALANTMLPRAGAAAMAVAGLCAVLGSFQTWMLVRFLGLALAAVPWLFVAMGAAALLVGAKLAGARRWAAVATIALGSLLAVTSGAWVIYAFTLHFTAFFLILTPVVAGLAVILAAIAIPTCDRADAARKRLGAQGLDLGM